MPSLLFAPAAFDDLDRLADFLLENSDLQAIETPRLLVEALAMLKDHPLVGRPVEAGLRELLISRGKSGHVALHRFDPERDSVLVLRVRHQRELGCP